MNVSGTKKPVKEIVDPLTRRSLRIKWNSEADTGSKDGSDTTPRHLIQNVLTIQGTSQPVTRSKRHVVDAVIFMQPPLSAAAKRSVRRHSSIASVDLDDVTCKYTPRTNILGFLEQAPEETPALRQISCEADNNSAMQDVSSLLVNEVRVPLLEDGNSKNADLMNVSTSGGRFRTKKRNLNIQLPEIFPQTQPQKPAQSADMVSHPSSVMQGSMTLPENGRQKSTHSNNEQTDTGQRQLHASVVSSEKEDHHQDKERNIFSDLFGDSLGVQNAVGLKDTADQAVPTGENQFENENHHCSVFDRSTDSTSIPSSPQSGRANSSLDQPAQSILMLKRTPTPVESTFIGDNVDRIEENDRTRTRHQSRKSTTSEYVDDSSMPGAVENNSLKSKKSVQTSYASDYSGTFEIKKTNSSKKRSEALTPTSAGGHILRSAKRLISEQEQTKNSPKPVDFQEASLSSRSTRQTQRSSDHADMSKNKTTQSVEKMSELSKPASGTKECSSPFSISVGQGINSLQEQNKQGTVSSDNAVINTKNLTQSTLSNYTPDRKILKRKALATSTPLPSKAMKMTPFPGTPDGKHSESVFDEDLGHSSTVSDRRNTARSNGIENDLADKGCGPSQNDADLRTLQKRSMSLGISKLSSHFENQTLPATASKNSRLNKLPALNPDGDDDMDSVFAEATMVQHSGAPDVTWHAADQPENSDEEENEYSPLKTPRLPDKQPTPTTVAPGRDQNASLKKTALGEMKRKAATSSHSAKKPCQGLPARVIQATFRHFCQLRTSKEALEEVEKLSEYYWKNMVQDLEDYAAHANRQTINSSDVELLMRRQGFITDTCSLNTLIAKYLPLELRQEMIPIARSGNQLQPKI